MDYNMIPITDSQQRPGMPDMSLEPVPMREVTPPTQAAVNFDTNMDLASGAPCHPPARDEYEPQFCDNLKQRVFDGQQFYKAQCLVLDDRAYWLQNRVRKAMFGSVWIGHALRRPTDVHGDDLSITHWETTGQTVAIKEVSRQMMAQARACGSAEDPRREHAAMQYVYEMVGRQELPADAMTRAGVMMPQDWLQDEHYCYLVMPYCDGGELFDRVGTKGRFTEDEARHWMHQILNCLETLHTAGLTHRDLSLENVMIHQDRAVIIDLGMSLNCPYDQNRQRRLLTPQGAAGKMKYMAPEVYANVETGFDGFAIDMWAVGVIMYIMLTGEVPWQLPHVSDLKFAKFTDGWIEPYLRGQGFPLSGNAFCLLQRMLWLNPRDRLCLHQVRAHPWMQMGSFGSPQPGIIRWRSANKGDGDEEERDAPKPLLRVEAPKTIQRGRYSKDESPTLSMEDMAMMQENVQKYTREENHVQGPTLTIQRGRYSNDDRATLSMEDMAAMQGNVQKYTREENRLEEDIVETVYESTVLSEDDPYVKKLRAKMDTKAE